MKWNCYLYRFHKMLFWLYAVEYANFNSQDAFNAELDVNGYHQGGLGDGVTTMLSYNDQFGYYPVVPCGMTLPLGNHTGTVEYKLLGSGGETVHTFSVPSYRGVENPFGHILHFVDGCKCIIQSEASGGLSKFYVCDDPAKFTPSGVDNYEYRGNLSRHDEGFITDIILGEDGEIMASEVGGSDSTYFCDSCFAMIPESGEDEWGVALSFNTASGKTNGLLCQLIGLPYNLADISFGTRLCYDPQAGTTTNQ